MNTQTPVERAAGLYQTALNDRRGKQCSEQQFFAAIGQAVEDVKQLLMAEGMRAEEAGRLAEAGKLLRRARHQGKVS